MRITINDNMAYFEDYGYVPGSTLKVEVDIQGLDLTQYSISAKINSLPSRSVVRVITVPLEVLRRNKTLRIDLTLKHKGTGVKRVFKMDPVPIREGFKIGSDILDSYPISYKEMKKDMAKLKKDMELNQRVLAELGKRGEVI